MSPQEITAREIDLGVGAVVVGVAGKDVQLNALLFKSYLLIDKVNDLGIDLAGSQRGDVISYFFDFDLRKGKAVGFEHDLQLGKVVGVETDCLSGEILNLGETAAAESDDA